MKKFNFLFLLAFILGVVFSHVAFGQNKKEEEKKAAKDTPIKMEPSGRVLPKPKAKLKPKAETTKTNKIKKRAKKMYAFFVTNQGNFKAELFHRRVPKTVDNFVSLAEGTKSFVDPKVGEKVKRPFYDGLVFHRVIPKFMIQGGCPLGNGRGNPGYTFADEFRPDLRHNKKGILSMANAGPNTNGSQFFITVNKTPFLDDKHSIFGEIVEGYEVVEKISKAKRDPKDKPIKPIIIKKVQIIRE